MAKSVLLAVLAIGLGLLAGYVDLHATEVQPPLLIVVVSAFALGLAQPRRAWRWALLVGPGILLAHLLADLVHYPSREGPQPYQWAVLIAVIPALFGAYAGAAVRWVLGELRGGAAPQA